MSDSNEREHLEEKHEPDRERRLEAVRRWVEYIKREPPEKWGPQQNAIVDAQLDAAQQVGTSAEHQQRVKRVADEIMQAREDGEESSE